MDEDISTYNRLKKEDPKAAARWPVVANDARPATHRPDVTGG